MEISIIPSENELKRDIRHSKLILLIPIALLIMMILTILDTEHILIKIILFIVLVTVIISRIIKIMDLKKLSITFKENKLQVIQIRGHFRQDIFRKLSYIEIKYTDIKEYKFIIEEGEKYIDRVRQNNEQRVNRLHHLRIVLNNKDEFYIFLEYYTKEQVEKIKTIIYSKINNN